MSYTKDQVNVRKFDVVIVGAGGSGMRASLQLARAGLNVAVLSKVFPPVRTPWPRRVALAPRLAT
jgi:succinate dehydrogenase / fumarate reductase flavoprotein subunit